MALEEQLAVSASRDLGPSTPRSAINNSSTPSLSSSSSSSSSSCLSENCLFFYFRGVNFKLSIPDSHFHLVEPHRNAFLASYSVKSGCPSRLELALEFLDFLLTYQTLSPDVACTVLRAFETEFLRNGTEIHSSIADLTTRSKDRQHWLGIYYRFVEASDRDNSGQPPSAFFQHVKANEFQTMAAFGGQGESSRTCVREFGELYISYRPILRQLVRAIGSRLYDLSTQDEFSSYYEGRQLDLEAWISDTAAAPDTAFISSAPVSAPIIGALSLARYCVTCHIVGYHPGEMRYLLHAATGHSQGLLAAIGIAASASWDNFYQNAQLIVEVLFRLGWECHHAAPHSFVPAAKYVEDDNANTPSYMLNVRGLRRKEIEAVINHINVGLPADKVLFLALVNAFDQFVIAGPVASLLCLERHLMEISSKDKDQSRVPFNDRKPCVQHGFIPVSTPFHTPYLTRAATRVKQYFSDRSINSHQLAIPVYHTQTGLDLRQREGNVLSMAIEAIASEECNWPSALAGYPASHILTFDRGGLAPLIKRVRDGWGIRVVQASELDTRDPEMATMRDLFAPRLLDSSTRLKSWGQQFQPQLRPGEHSQLETRLSQIIGAPPIMVAGMTPTTVHPDFVAAIMNAGYHAELAGGGYHTAPQMEAAIKNLVNNIEQGRGVTCNLIYANPRSMSWQINLLRRLSQNRVPIDGLTIGAGVPSLDIASSYIESLGLRHISFKPGSADTIRQVVEIARKHPSFPVILQWTGGRGGGHHSFEDFHAPIIAMYGLIRQQPNIYLVAGSGFGDSDSIYPYLSGCWSTAMGCPAMPFDGILLGSRMMVATEAHTSLAARRIIASTPGVPDAEWEKTYTGPAGGLVTVRSEMGEPIHKIVTRGVRLWAEMDRTVFSLSEKRRLEYLVRHRHSIIQRLNADFAKQWFGRDSKGQVVDLEEMTYLDVLTRLVGLMHIAQTRWIDESYIDLTMAVARRWLERLRFIPIHASGLGTDILRQSPDRFLESFARACPTAEDDLLNPEDVSFFLKQCKQPGRKPVNFIPALDEDFEFYFKKDSLWQAEDIDAVEGCDAQRVCILHGPVAAQYSRYPSEPAGYILDSITEGVVTRLHENSMAEELVPDLESGLATPASWSSVSSNGRELSEETLSTSITSLSDPSDDASFSSGGVNNTPKPAYPLWIRALLENNVILQRGVRQKNLFHWSMKAIPGASMEYHPDACELVVTVQESHQVVSSMKAICHNSSDIMIEINPPKGSEPLRLFYGFDQTNASLRIREVMERRNERIKSFYSHLWFGDELVRDKSLEDTFYGPQITLTQDMLDEHTATIGLAFIDRRQMAMGTDVLPINFGIIITWDVISQPLTLFQVGGDLLRLVHRSNSFDYYPDATPLRLGETVTSESSVCGIYDEDAGRVVTIEGRVLRDGAPVMLVTSTFLFRGCKEHPASLFRRVREKAWRYDIVSEMEESILLSRGWFTQYPPVVPLVGKSAIFTLESTYKHKDSGVVDLHVTGAVTIEASGGQRQPVGVVHFKGKCTGNPVVDFLERRGKLAQAHCRLDNPGWTGKSSMDIQMPRSNQPYAQLSRDFNPVHTSPIFASLAGLPGTLCHGMCTSAIVETVLEYLGLQGNRERLRRFDTRFLEMVMPGERLIVKVQHVGMVDGRMRFMVLASRKDNEELVLEAEAEAEQPRTAYLFTGQGSQSKGMGMDLYDTSPVAKAVWDDIDEQLSDAYGKSSAYLTSPEKCLMCGIGWSILDIVRNNPKVLTIHFGGRNGRRIRQKYLDITTEVVLADGKRVQKPVFAGLTSTSASYTFIHPRGLLYSTQFAQPAILLFEAAAFAELRAKGFVSQGALYAGHSLGEYGALSALSRSIPTGALVELAFYRGSVMQASVSRDDQGATTYGMVAMNPKRVGQGRPPRCSDNHRNAKDSSFYTVHARLPCSPDRGPEPGVARNCEFQY